MYLRYHWHKPLTIEPHRNCVDKIVNISLIGTMHPKYFAILRNFWPCTALFCRLVLFTGFAALYGPFLETPKQLMWLMSLTNFGATEALCCRSAASRSIVTKTATLHIRQTIPLIGYISHTQARFAVTGSAHVNPIQNLLASLSC